MGPNTKVNDRMLLKYDGKKGTKNFFLPTTYSDLVSFEHDLLYWAPKNIIKAYADTKFIRDIRSPVGLTGIVLQYAKRLGWEGTYNYALLKAILSGTKNFLDEFKLIPQTRQSLKTMDREMLNRNREISQLESLIKMPQREAETIVNVLDLFPDSDVPQLLQSKKLEKFWADKNYGRIKYDLYSKLLFNILPKTILTGMIVAPQIEYSAKQIYDSVKSLFVENPEYTKLNKIVTGVVDTYKDFLKVIGDFEDATWIQSSSIPFKKDGEQIFRIKENYDKDKAVKAYKDFYEGYWNYKNFMNGKYKNVRGYTPFELDRLDRELEELDRNIDIIKNLENVPSGKLEEIFGDFKPTDIKNTNIITGGEGNYTKTESEDIKELNEEIEKVLRKEIEEPFTTMAEDIDDEPKPSPTPEPTTPSPTPEPTTPSPTPEPTPPPPSPTPPVFYEDVIRDDVMSNIIKALGRDEVDYDFGELADIINEIF
jgi:hypothetical protein